MKKDKYSLCPTGAYNRFGEIIDTQQQKLRNNINNKNN